MYYIDTRTGKYPISQYEIKQAHPNTSFSEVFSAPEGYAPVIQTAPPVSDQTTQAVREVAPALVNGRWEQQWEVVALDADAIAANQAQANAARKTAILAELATIDLKSIRALREGYQPRIDELDAQAAALRAEMAAL